MKIKRFLILIIVLAACSFVGCANVDDIYNQSKVKSEYYKLFNKDNYEEVRDLTFKQRVHYYGLKILNKEKPIATVIAIVSVIIGILIFRAVEKNNKIRQTVIYVFWIGIPVFCALITVLLAVIVHFAGK